MNSLLGIGCLASILSVAIGGNYPVEIAQEIRINTNTGKGFESKLGVVYGARTCGGPGKLAEWRFEGCDTTDTPCRFPADGFLHRSELDFTPSRDITQLGLRLSISIEGEEPIRIYERTFSDCSVEGGLQHTISGAARVLPALQGRNLTTQHILYRVEGEIIEICAEADFVVV